MTSSVSLPSLSPAAIQTIRSVGGTTAIQAPSAARPPSPIASPSLGALGTLSSPPSPDTPRGSLLNLTV